jgi:hypothetical protein
MLKWVKSGRGWIRSLWNIDPVTDDSCSPPLTRADYDELMNDSRSSATGSYPDETRRARALAQAYEQRKFEIELYWKRATYFWTFIGAAFVGYAAFLNASQPHLIGALLMSQVGLVFTVAWYLVNRGSKFWQENWENHVDLLEDEVTGPIYKVRAERDPEAERKRNTWDYRWTSPQPRSVSKINTIISMYVILIWILLGLAVVARWVAALFVWDLGSRMAQALIHGTVLIVAVLSTGAAWVVLLRQSGTHMGRHTPLLTRRVVAVARDGNNGDAVAEPASPIDRPLA